MTLDKKVFKRFIARFTAWVSHKETHRHVEILVKHLLRCFLQKQVTVKCLLQAERLIDFFFDHPFFSKTP